VTLAEIREVLRLEVTAAALAGRDVKGVALEQLLLRRGKALVKRYVLPGQQIRWHGTLYGQDALIVERVEDDQVMLDQPRLVISMTFFLRCLLSRKARDP